MADAVPGRTGFPGRYAFGDSGAARAAFGARTVEADLGFLLPHLRPDMRVIDCGCGNGALALQLALRVAEVIGFDANAGAIVQARQAAAAAGRSNARFLTGSVHDVPLREQSFDVALFCGVLGHVPQPERALAQVWRLLKPGGLLAARELAKQGDWFGGPYWETISDINEMHADAIVAGGGDPFIGRRMASLLAAASFVRVRTEPAFSPALSSVTVIGALFRRRLEEPEFVAKVVGRGRHSADRLHAMIGEVDAWTTHEASIAAISECVALGWKAG